MTLRRCRFDCPFPVTWLGNVWEPAPPSLPYRSKPTIKPSVSGLKDQIPLRYHMDLWLVLLVLIYQQPHHPNITPLDNCKIGALSKHLSFFQSLCFLRRAAFCPSSASSQSCFKRARQRHNWNVCFFLRSLSRALRKKLTRANIKSAWQRQCEFIPTFGISVATAELSSRVPTKN